MWETQTTSGSTPTRTSIMNKFETSFISGLSLKSQTMILGTFIFLCALYLGHKIVPLRRIGLEDLEKESCCETRSLLPDKVFEYVTYMIFNDKISRLGWTMIGYLLFYYIGVLVLSSFLGLVLIKPPAPYGLILGYGLAFYLVLESIVVFFTGVYCLWRTTLSNNREMQNLKRDVVKRAREDGTPVKDMADAMVEDLLSKA